MLKILHSIHLGIFFTKKKFPKQNAFLSTSVPRAIFSHYSHQLPFTSVFTLVFISPLSLCFLYHCPPAPTTRGHAHTRQNLQNKFGVYTTYNQNCKMLSCECIPTAWIESKLQQCFVSVNYLFSLLPNELQINRT